MKRIEKWKDVIGFEGCYEVSNFGRVRNAKSKAVLKQATTRKGYKAVSLFVNGTGKTIEVHRIVALAFIENENGYPEVNHIDEDKTNNCVSNLEWCSHAYNMAYGTGRARAAKACQKPVVQYLHGVEVARFDSIKEAGKITGCDPGHISQCCRGYVYRQHVNGYSFAYA